LIDGALSFGAAGQGFDGWCRQPDGWCSVNELDKDTHPRKYLAHVLSN